MSGDISKDDVRPFINYYAREGYYRHLQEVCKDKLKKRASDPVLRFWRAFGVCMEGGSGPNAAIREFSELQSSPDVKLAATAAALHAHQMCTHVDDDAVEMLEMKVEELESAAKPADLLQAAQFYCHVGEYNQARDLTKHILTREQQNVAALTLSGWIDLQCGRETLAAKSVRHFDSADSKGRSVDSLLGRAKYWQQKRARSKEEREENLNKSLDGLMNTVAQCPWFLPALIEEIKVFVMLGKWEEALDPAQRVLAQEPRNIEALRFHVMYLLVRESRYQQAHVRLGDLVDSVAEHEPQNASLYYRLSQSIARVAGRNPEVTELTLRLVQQARKLEPSNSLYAAECGEQLLLRPQDPASVVNAGHAFREATSLDEDNVAAHYGIIKCQILEGNLEDAAQQHEFLNVIQSGVGGNASLTFLGALLQWRKESNKEGAVSLLDQAMVLHKQEIKNMSMGYEYFTALNPDFLVQVAQQYLQHCPTEPTPAAEAGKDQITLRKAVGVLQMTLQAVPGLVEAQLLLARTQYIDNEFAGAKRAIQECLKLNPNISEANVILAQIYLSEEQYKDALSSLEQALAYNFEVRSSPLYSIIKAKVLENVGELHEALALLKEAMALPSIRTGEGVGLHERASVFVQYAQVLIKLKELRQAKRVMSQAKEHFIGTSEEMRVTIVDCDLAIARGDFDKVVGRLSAVPPESPHFVKARTTLADVYLNHRNDKLKYRKCFEDLAKQTKSAQAYIAFGEACVKINEPDDAIRNFEIALELNPGDVSLRSKIGKALVATHDYEKAKKYYLDALEAQPRDTSLALELASLCMRLGKRLEGEYEIARRVLERAKTALLGHDDSTASIASGVKLLMLLAQLYKDYDFGEGHGLDKATEALMQARALQSKLPRDSASAKQLGTHICFTLAEYRAEFAKRSGERERDQEHALRFYREALAHDNAHEASLIALAELHKERNELKECQTQCVTLLRIDPANDRASMMLAELMWMKKETESAIYHFQQLLDKKPNYYIALEKLIKLLRHAGRLSEAPKYLEVAERSSTRPERDAGLQYCKGLYNRYTNKLRDALSCFYRAKKGAEWGLPAHYHMIEIYLDPNKDAFLGDDGVAAEGGFSGKSGGAGGGAAHSHERFQDAQRLLAEIKHDRRLRPEDVQRTELLQCYCLMANNSKPDIERAHKNFMAMLGSGMDNVPALVGTAVAHLKLNQKPKARNQLKRVAKLDYRPQYAEDFERGWLMLADMYCSTGKYDMAQDLCRKCLKHNQSCAKAWEYMGLVMEKEQSYADAADAYERAWKYESERSATVGYKLAWNYLKAKRYVETINICNQVLAKFRDYPKIKKDILDKAIAQLRT